MGFIRRVTQFPPTSFITQIEGITIVDQDQPPTVQGVGTGVCCVVGEFPDMTYAVAVNPTTGAITTSPTPVQLFSTTDMLTKVGGFDSTIGQFGNACGNGYVEVQNKTFATLIAVPINLASPLGVRMWRVLPTNTSATNPSPITAVVGASVTAGTQFKSGTNRVNSGKLISFTGTPAYQSGTDGSVTSGGAAATQTFNSAGATFQGSSSIQAVKVGDILVVGVIGAAGAQGANAATYRVNAVTSNTALSVEQLNGANFDWTTGTAQAWRIHVAATADTGGNTFLANAAGSNIPARPLDTSIAQATIISPTISAPAATATTWNPLSGLAMSTNPTAPGLVYDATIQAPNAANSANLNALYYTALQSLLQDNPPANTVDIVWSARKCATIANYLRQHVDVQSSQGTGRVAIVSPGLSAQDISVVTGNASAGATAPIFGVGSTSGAGRDQDVFYSWPGAITSIPAASGISIACADGTTTTDGNLDVTYDSYIASVCSVLPPERNPGEATGFTLPNQASVLGFQRGAPNLGINEYILIKQSGIAALRIDSTVGPLIQSGITTSLISGEQNINRRRMSFFIEDSLGNALIQFNKQLLSNELIDSAEIEINGFLLNLLSPNNPAAQRINGYLIDTKSGNTPDLLAQGLFVFIVRVRMTPTADYIVLAAQVGTTVDVTTIG